MNHMRIMRATNGLLMVIGYQLHHFDVKSRRFRLSLWIVGHFIMISVLYAIAFTHHFERSAILYLLKDVSPFLRRLIGIQLFLGLKVYLFGIHQFRLITRATNELADILPRVFAKKFCLQEAYTYFLNYSTLIICFCITLYVAYERKFILPPLDNILIFLGIFIPHFILGGALKLYNVGTWLLREQLLEFQGDFQRMIPDNVENHNNKGVGTLENGEKTNSPELAAVQDLSTSLQGLHKQLEELVKTAEIFNGALGRQVGLLVLLNCNCLLGGTYARVYYESTWHLLFMGSTKRIFEATNCGIFILIFWDYMTLFLTQILFLKVRTTFLKSIRSALKRCESSTEPTRIILEDIHEQLKEGFKPKFFNMIEFNLLSFLVFQTLFGIVVALIVIYHYLNDQIFALSERFDSLDEVDD